MSLPHPKGERKNRYRAGGRVSPYWEDCFGIVSKQEYSSGEGGDPLGKFIILSFSDGEDTVFANTVTALASVADFSTVAASADAPLLFSSLQIDPQRRLVWQSGQTVDLTPMEFDILLLLARRPGQVFTARQIYEAVAADSFDASWTGISSMVYKLRRKLGAGIIETVRGHGYKFVAPETSPK